jgi:glycosyltransferase involved in cell wall biosynthesis
MKDQDLIISVILTTYNQAEWLRKSLIGYEYQSDKAFELLIADDGSGEETRKVVEEFTERGNISIRHIWHEDLGFRKCEILNKAIVESGGNYLLFSDGDCIPRADFVEKHRKHAQPGRFLSGGYFKLHMKPSGKIAEVDILEQKPFQVRWLLTNGQPFSHRLLKMTRNESFGRVLDALTPTRASWNGHNSSGWKEDIIAVNGYNEDMQYGGLDRELGERLENAGIRGKQIRYRAVCVHLDHPRPYKTSETLSKNKAIRDKVKNDKVTYTPNGIQK